MNVMYTCDNNYVWLMGISAISLFENNKDIEELNVYLLGEKINNDNKKKLEDIATNYGRNITVIDVPEFDIPEVLVSERWPLSAFTRLYSAQLLPNDINHVLYLDCDTVVKGNLDSIYQYVSADKIVWGVKDCIGKRYKANIGLVDNDNYINAGVLFINIDRLREIEISDQIESYLRRYKDYINYADQDVLNGIFRDEIGIIPPQFDVMTIDATYSYHEIQTLRKPTNFYDENELEAAVLDPIIIHYTTNMTVIRPWFSNTNHPFADEFRRYLMISPWRDRKLAEMVFKEKEYKIIGAVEKLPRGLSLRILGFLHSTLKPVYIKLANLR